MTTGQDRAVHLLEQLEKELKDEEAEKLEDGTPSVSALCVTRDETTVEEGAELSELEEELQREEEIRLLYEQRSLLDQVTTTEEYLKLKATKCDHNIFWNLTECVYCLDGEFCLSV